MSDWDILGQGQIQNSEDDQYDTFLVSDSEEEEEVYEIIDQSRSYTPSTLGGRSYDITDSMDSPLSGTGSKNIGLKSKRDDRVAYRHRTGEGIRRGHLNTGRDIDEAIALYNEGVGSYNDRVQELRQASIDDLIPDHEKDQKDVPSGGASKIIQIIKVKKGTLSKIKGERSPNFKSNIITQKIDTDPKHYWDHVSHQLMEDGFFVQSKYDQFREVAVNERTKLGPGQSSEMNSLYCFWCFYLREHFDQTMYDDFLSLARDDIKGGSHYGIECFFRFCSYGLEINWIPSVFNDFEIESMEDYKRKSTYGLEKFKAFLINQKHPFTIPVKPETRAVLAKFPTMKSFRNNQPHQKILSASQKRERLKQSPPAQVAPAPPAPVVQSTSPVIVEWNSDTRQQQAPTVDTKPTTKAPLPTNAPAAPNKKQLEEISKKPKNRRTQSNIQFTFGKQQPSSAPNDSLMKRRW